MVAHAVPCLFGLKSHMFWHKVPHVHVKVSKDLISVSSRIITLMYDYPHVWLSSCMTTLMYTYWCDPIQFQCHASVHVPDFMFMYHVTDFMLYYQLMIMFMFFSLVNSLCSKSGIRSFLRSPFIFMISFWLMSVRSSPCDQLQPWP